MEKPRIFSKEFVQAIITESKRLNLISPNGSALHVFMTSAETSIPDMQLSEFELLKHRHAISGQMLTIALGENTVTGLYSLTLSEDEEEGEKQLAAEEKGNVLSFPTKKG